MTISSWLNFGRPAPTGRGSVAGRKFSAPPYYSQRAGFASLWALFHFSPQYNLSVESNQNVESKRQSVESKIGKWGVRPTFDILTILHLKWLLSHSGDFHFQFCSFIFGDLWHISVLLLCYVVSSPRPCTGAFPLDPSGGLPSSDPFLWSPKNP